MPAVLSTSRAFACVLSPDHSCSSMSLIASIRSLGGPHDVGVECKTQGIYDCVPISASIRVSPFSPGPNKLTLSEAREEEAMGAVC